MPRRNTNLRNAPPQIRSNVVYRHRFRYTSSSGTATVLTGNSILAAAGSVCYQANTNVASINQSFKIVELELFGAPAAQGSTSTVSIEWLGTANAPSVEVSDTTNSVATPAHVKSRPPRDSQAVFWQTPSSASNNLVTLVAPAGTIIDIVLELVQNDDQLQVNTGVAAGALGSLYYLSLDPNATHRYVPVSLNTTV